MKKGTERDDDMVSRSDWETPAFLRIKTKKGKRTGPYLETELWERDELLLVVKYELFKRNKADSVLGSRCSKPRSNVIED
jgi:hypothetical protein